MTRLQRVHLAAVVELGQVDVLPAREDRAEGVDISAPDGTAVYPVASGKVTNVTPVWVRVDSMDRGSRLADTRDQVARPAGDSVGEHGVDPLAALRGQVVQERAQLIDLG